MDIQQIESTTGSRVGNLEKDLAVLDERLSNTISTVETNELRVDTLRKAMWKASGIVCLISMIPLVLTIINFIRG